MASPFSVIFLGNSGSGKGTQAEMLKQHMQEKGIAPVFHLQSGDRFREFIKGTNYSSQISNAIYEKGILQPEFLSVWIWSNLLIQNMEKNGHVLFDGMPRKVNEAQILESAFNFYQFEKVYCIDLRVSPEVANKRMSLRGRADDIDPEVIATRLRWFETDVVPLIEYYKNNPRYVYVPLNGEDTPEEIHQKVLSAVGLN